MFVNFPFQPAKRAFIMSMINCRCTILSLVVEMGSPRQVTSKLHQILQFLTSDRRHRGFPFVYLRLDCIGHYLFASLCCAFLPLKFSLQLCRSFKKMELCMAEPLVHLVRPFHHMLARGHCVVCILSRLSLCRHQHEKAIFMHCYP